MCIRDSWEGGHGTTSQHYAGVAFDVGQRSTATERRKIYRAAVRSGAWGYVEPTSMTPTWVHFDRRYGKPACAGTTAGYPTLRRGSRSTYVLVLQDALNALGLSLIHICPKYRWALRTAVSSAGSKVLVGVSLSGRLISGIHWPETDTPTSTFDPALETAVRSAQRYFGLTETGIVTAADWTVPVSYTHLRSRHRGYN